MDESAPITTPTPPEDQDPSLIPQLSFEEQTRVNQGLQRLTQLAELGQTPEGAVFSGLSQELEAISADPGKLSELNTALLAWANTPYVDGSRGEDEQGTNGGVEHFFAYRADKLKGSRWQTPGLAEYPPTLEGFIQLSRELFQAANSPEDSDKTKMAYDLTDEAGNKRRMGNFAGHHQYVAFKTAGQTHFLISSLFPIRDMSLIGSMVKNEVKKWPDKEANRVNRLTSAPKFERVR